MREPLSCSWKLEPIAAYTGRAGRCLFVICAWLAGPSSQANLVSNLTSNTTHPSIGAAAASASAGDTLYVFPGVYTETLTIGQSITIIGQHASNTILQASALPAAQGLSVVRVNSGSCRLEQLTIRNGHAQWQQDGGGVSASASSTTTLSRCVLTGNVGATGGGAYRCILDRCVVTSNTAWFGGGVADCELTACLVSGNRADQGGGSTRSLLKQCTVTGNRADFIGGGVSGSSITNCIVYHNTAPVASNLFDSTAAYSCTVPDPGGAGNLTEDPQLVSASRISPTSPCRGQADPDYATGADLDGEPWYNPPSMGCDEPVVGTLTGSLHVTVSTGHTLCATGWPVKVHAEIVGRVERTRWDFGDGNAISNRPYATHAWAAPGTYAVVCTAWNADYTSGVSDTVTVEVVERPVHYVAEGNPGASFPYASWETAAAVLQDGVDAAVVPGAIVLVSNGIYDTGGRPFAGGLSNRVAVTAPVTVRSLHGPEVTFIVGQSDGGQLGPGASRCAYVGAGATLEGFTLSNGYTWASSGYPGGNGGGAFADVSGTLRGCVVIGNQAYTGAGVTGGVIDRCLIRGNTAEDQGGGARGGVIRNCILKENEASMSGGGGQSGVWVNSTITGNTSLFGGGTSFGLAVDCIVYDNGMFNSGHDNHYRTPMYRCCTSPLPSPELDHNCISDPPGFAWIPEGDLHLSALSPCIDAGSLHCLGGEEDLDGLNRVSGAIVDLGAYEYADRDGDGLPDYWEIRHDLDPDDNGTGNPENGASGDPDSDRATNFHEFQTWTLPRDGDSAFIVSRSDYDTEVETCSVTVRTEPGRTYTIEYLDVPPLGYTWRWLPFRSFGTWYETNNTPAQKTFVDDFSLDTTGRPSLWGTRFYRVKQLP